MDRKLQIPQNVNIQYRNLNQISSLASEKLGFSISIENGYKLCDFKPAYGLIFEDYLSEFDFWGHGDLDVIYGDIRNFMNNELLSEYDLLSVRHDYITGHFALFRNSDKLKTLFSRSRDFKKVFQSPENFCFDETNYAFKLFTQGVELSLIRKFCRIESMTYVVKTLMERNEINAYFDFLIIEGTPGKLKWENGILIYKNKYEIMMYHLIKLKTVYKPKDFYRRYPNRFYISPSKIYTR